MSADDNMNCLKNLMQLMCIDGNIRPKEKQFLKTAAEQLDVTVDDWNGLLKEVLRDNIPLYTILEREQGVAALKAMILMAKHDGHLDEKERRYVLQFAKAIGISRREWTALLSTIESENLFAPFQKPQGSLLALTDDFERLEAFQKAVRDYGADIQTCSLNQYMKSESVSKAVVCFHAAPEKELSLARCQLLQGKAGDRLLCILTRFQGHQVKYLHEIGLKKCVIEPIYTRDIIDMLKTAP
jgi:uncharacterized tellurite resistance protein B-like protein